MKDLAMSVEKRQQQLKGRWRSKRRNEEAEIAMLTGQVRRLLSQEAVHSQARCLLDCVRGLVDGAAAAARRRHWAEMRRRDCVLSYGNYLELALEGSTSQSSLSLWPDTFGLIFVELST